MKRPFALRIFYNGKYKQTNTYSSEDKREKGISSIMKLIGGNKFTFEKYTKTEENKECLMITSETKRTLYEYFNKQTLEKVREIAIENKMNTIALEKAFDEIYNKLDEEFKKKELV